MSSNRYSIHLDRNPAAVLDALEKETAEASDLDTITTFIESSVGRGHFAVAADLSDHVRVHYPSLLNAHPRISIRLNIEHLKRVSYMGYVNPVRRAACVVLGGLKNAQWKRGLSDSDRAHYEFVANGYMAWLEDNPTRLTTFIEKCESARARYQGPLSHVVHAFLLGMKGHHASLMRNLSSANEHFSNALTLLTDESDFRSKAHLYIIYAEALSKLNEHDQSCKVLNTFLGRCTEKSFSSHLLLRAVTQLLRMNANGFIALGEQEKRWLLFQGWALINSFGLSQHVGICPLLMDAQLVLEQLSDKWLTAEAYRQRLLKLVQGFQGQGEQMEIFLRDWLLARGFNTRKLDHGAPVFDCVGTMDAKGHVIRVALQSKSWSNVVRQRDVPDLHYWNGARDQLRLDGCFPIHCLIWYCASGIDVNAKKKLHDSCESAFGSLCEVRCLDSEALVELLLDEPDTLVKLMARQRRMESLVG